MNIINKKRITKKTSRSLSINTLFIPDPSRSSVIDGRNIPGPQDRIVGESPFSGHTWILREVHVVGLRLVPSFHVVYFSCSLPWVVHMGNIVMLECPCHWEIISWCFLCAFFLTSLDLVMFAPSWILMSSCRWLQARLEEEHNARWCIHVRMCYEKLELKICYLCFLATECPQFVWLYLSTCIIWGLPKRCNSR